MAAAVAVVMGAEAEGVSDDMRAAADAWVTLPMYGFVESLNVSVATALVLQAVLALAGDDCRGDLPPERKEALSVEWTTRLCAPGRGRRKATVPHSAAVAKAAVTELHGCPGAARSSMAV